ncbi:MAG: phosphoribosylanthranilate isomerase [Victivallales bacterium]|jgi:phosphoribosylanthranilate isomerase
MIAGKSKLFVKICGITRAEDAVFASGCGADALGFIAYPKSPRFINASSVRGIVGEIPGNVLKAAVFVNPTIDEVMKYVGAGVNVIQLHGDETAEFAEEIAKFAEVWKAIRPETAKDVLKYSDYPADKFLIDTFSGSAYGGTGKTGDWDSAKFAVETLNKPVILAGGLNPANIAEAVKSVDPYGIDVSSGVESSPGVKDHGKLTLLFSEIRKLRQHIAGHPAG